MDGVFRNEWTQQPQNQGMTRLQLLRREQPLKSMAALLLVLLRWLLCLDHTTTNGNNGMCSASSFGKRHIHSSPDPLATEKQETQAKVAQD